LLSPFVDLFISGGVPLLIIQQKQKVYTLFEERNKKNPTVGRDDGAKQISII